MDKKKARIAASKEYNKKYKKGVPMRFISSQTSPTQALAERNKHIRGHDLAWLVVCRAYARYASKRWACLSEPCNNSVGKRRA
eukprot:5641505-Amphidinium_carterae.1